MRVLITGIGGFVGRHLAAHLAQTRPDDALHGVVLSAPQNPVAGEPVLHTLDLRDEQAVLAMLERVRPDAVYHLAAWAEVGASFDRPWTTIENNVRSQANLLTGCIHLGLRPRMLVVTSGEIYGGCGEDGLPSREDAPLRPANPYSVSKVTQDMLAFQYYLSHQLPIVRARPFNHIGPGQNTGFVAPDFATQIARIEAGQQEPKMQVGDLSAERDMTDVRDIVRAYALLMERGTSGEVYNVASGTNVPVQAILDTLLALSPASIEVVRDPARTRLSGVRRSMGDNTRLKAATGWQPVIPLQETLRDLLEECRVRVTAQQASR